MFVAELIVVINIVVLWPLFPVRSVPRSLIIPMLGLANLINENRGGLGKR